MYFTYLFPKILNVYIFMLKNNNNTHIIKNKKNKKKNKPRLTSVPAGDRKKLVGRPGHIHRPRLIWGGGVK